jgi:hypothetical protein
MLEQWILELRKVEEAAAEADEKLQITGREDRACYDETF